MKKSKQITWVIKVGSNVLIDGGPLLIRAYAEQLAKLKRLHQIRVVWVTSGAIASARARTGRTAKILAEKQALSAIGQPLLMDVYNLALQSQGLMGAQVLLSYDDLKNSQRRQNLQATLQTLLAWDVVPVLNENDTVATDEIQFGDNDNLSAMVATLVAADRLLLLTNVDGLYDKDPQKHRDAKLIQSVARVTEKLVAKIDSKALSNNGRGGMYSKIKASAIAQKRGIVVQILKGDLPNVLVRVAEGEPLGTKVGFSDNRKRAIPQS